MVVLAMLVGAASVLAYAAVSAVRVAGAQAWVARYDSGRQANDWGGAAVASPDGSRVYVTGEAGTSTREKSELLTVAVNAASGAVAWAKRLDAGAGIDAGYAIAVSPDGSKLYVAGQSFGEQENSSDFLIVAYASATGTLLWQRRYNGPANRWDAASAVAVSPDGKRVYVGGTSDAWATRNDFVAIAYDAASGSTLWVRRYDTPRHTHDLLRGLTLSGDGSIVVLTGTTDTDVTSSGFIVDMDYLTVAYSAAGTKLWERLYDDPSAEGTYDRVESAAVSADGRVYVTGRGGNASHGTPKEDFVTVAYDLGTGRELWVQRYEGPAAGDGNDRASAVVVSPDGARVFVTGDSAGADGDVDVATVAYGATGGQLWARRYDASTAPGVGAAGRALSVSPSGHEVYVGGGVHFDILAIAYTATGTRRWLRTYDGPASGGDTARSVVRSPDGGRIYVTGTSTGATTGEDLVTIAYTTS